MNIAIRYYSKSKKGNTLKLATRAGNYLNIEVKTIDEPLNEKVDILFLFNAMYAFDIDKEIKHFLKDNKDNISLLVNINSAASGASTYKSVKKVCDKYNINLSEKEYHCIGSWLKLNPDRPNENDMLKLEEFLKEFVE